MLPRLEYLAFVKAVRNSEFVITDGGGNQEELSYLGKPTLLFRDETERKEGLGENVVLSKLDRATIDAFVDDYKSLARAEGVPDHSPARTIVSFLVERGFG
jgi:UDP-N-acetylglucosamine 2-epimerase (non-hydrolysing)